MLNCIFFSVHKQKILNTFLAYLLQLDVSSFLKNGDNSDTGFHRLIFKIFFLVSKKNQPMWVFDSDVTPMNLSRVSINIENTTLFTVLKSCLKKIEHISEDCILASSLQLVEFLSSVKAMVKIIINYCFVKFKVLMSFVNFKILWIAGWFLSSHFLCHQMVVFRIWTASY